MGKRIAAIPLWFVSVWLMYGLIAYFAGWPTSAGAILGALAAASVFMDPAGVFWAPAKPTPATPPRILSGSVDRAI